jgi:hypothetical protein
MCGGWLISYSQDPAIVPSSVYINTKGDPVPELCWDVMAGRMNPRKFPYLVLTTRPEGDEPLALAPADATDAVAGAAGRSTPMDAALADALMTPAKEDGQHWSVIQATTRSSNNLTRATATESRTVLICWPSLPDAFAVRVFFFLFLFSSGCFFIFTSYHHDHHRVSL